ncbi:MAG: hypothetical protein D6742_11925 [Cyanobacteria bacterium J069]|nr:MAG: hypothetical protein D6742_11925 [Cyanobacteria bacterium J069]
MYLAIQIKTSTDISLYKMLFVCQSAISLILISLGFLVFELFRYFSWIWLFEDVFIQQTLSMFRCFVLVCEEL